jgi:hypothetical protein
VADYRVQLSRVLPMSGSPCPGSTLLDACQLLNQEPEHDFVFTDDSVSSND